MRIQFQDYTDFDDVQKLCAKLRRENFISVETIHVNGHPYSWRIWFWT